MKPTAFLAAITGLVLVPTAVAGDSEITVIPATQLDYQVTPEGVAFARLRGDRFEGAYMAMVRLPAGFVSPPHVKSANMYGIVVSGAMTHLPAGADPSGGVRLETGAFYEVPKGLAHVSRCVSDVACVTFLYQDGRFDFLPVKP